MAGVVLEADAGSGFNPGDRIFAMTDGFLWSTDVHGGSRAGVRGLRGVEAAAPRRREETPSPRVGRGSSSAGSSRPGARPERARPESERERETWWTHAPLHPPPPSSGCYAERVAVPAADAAPAPTTISLTHAAAVPLVALTAVQTIEATPPSARARGSLALVHAGAGGVGHVAVQLLVRRYGMVVTATCGPANDAFVRACGAVTTLDYRSPTFAADLAAAGPYHLIFDLIGGDAAAASRGLVAEGGAFAEVFNTGTTEAGSAANKAAAEASGGTYVGPTLVHAGDGAALKADRGGHRFGQALRRRRRRPPFGPSRRSARPPGDAARARQDRAAGGGRGRAAVGRGRGRGSARGRACRAIPRL